MRDATVSAETRGMPKEGVEEKEEDSGAWAANDASGQEAGACSAEAEGAKALAIDGTGQEADASCAACPKSGKFCSLGSPGAQVFWLLRLVMLPLLRLLREEEPPERRRPLLIGEALVLERGVGVANPSFDGVKRHRRTLAEERWSGVDRDGTASVLWREQKEDEALCAAAAASVVVGVLSGVWNSSVRGLDQGLAIMGESGASCIISGGTRRRPAAARGEDGRARMNE